ncbi:glutathione S-transferase family protein [Acidimangrovimonas sediminis]|uniref:glutathione S-transferase family protein n=1 Tax=Acidimangrovimonas sediminis TaxID=2056283 RepID=UPI000C7FCBB8|nr:glutathione S-transferase family protein [Acidimangrovimonas sediminis]
MLTLYHAPQSRSSRIVALIDEMAISDKVRIHDVNIFRALTGTGAADPANPHPEGKVPYLVDGAETVREGIAIMLYLLERFPGTGLGADPGAPDRGRFLGWMSYYASVVEPVVLLDKLGIDHPFARFAYRGLDEVMAAFRMPLAEWPWLMGDRYTAVDLVMGSIFGFHPGAMPDDPLIRDWAARCAARPAQAHVQARDREAMARIDTAAMAGPA